jgi:iron complex transport system substrate-binding protein
MKERLQVRACLTVLLAVLSLSGEAREITDMAGRKVTLPDHITKVYAAQPYTNLLLYMVAPDLLLGQQPGCLPFREEDKRFLRPEVARLPVLEVQLGRGENAQRNIEAILALHPDFALANGGTAPDNMKADPSRLEARFAKIGLPVVFVDVRRIADYPAGIEFVGRILGREERARQLSAYATRVLAEVEKAVATIPPEKRVRVYYSESADGLATESDSSFHADAITVAGGAIVHHGELKTHVGMEKLSLEQVLLYDPEIIISQEPDFLTNVYQDARWRNVKAVVNRRIYTIPRSPFNWIDRPPSVMRVIGVQWLAHLFYPQQYPIDIRATVREFHRLFMGVEVSDADLDAWLK